MKIQEKFEAIYADYTQTPIEQIVAARLGEDSYSLPAISKAWVWYAFGQEALLQNQYYEELSKRVK